MGVMEDRRRIIAAQPHLVTASGSSVLVNIAEPKIERLKVTFSPVQTGSGTPSPSNVRPIMGWATIAASIGTVPVDITLGGTYYGGTVDLVSGVMTVTWGTLDLGSLNYFTVADTGGNLFRTTGTRGTIRPADWMGGVLEAKCQIYTSRSGDETYRGVYDYSMGTDGTGQLYIYDSSRTGMTAAQFKSSVSGIPLVYRYIDPITVTLTPQTILALRGQQTVTSPAGSVSISYWTH